MIITKLNGSYITMLEEKDLTDQLPRATNEDEPSDERRGEE